MKSIIPLIVMGLLVSCAHKKVYQLAGPNNEKVIRTALMDTLPKFQKCAYDNYSTQNNKPSGMVVLNFSILEDGKVSNTHITEGMQFSQQLLNCIATEVNSLKFKKKSPGTIEFKQPMSFFPKS